MTERRLTTDDDREAARLQEILDRLAPGLPTRESG